MDDDSAAKHQMLVAVYPQQSDLFQIAVLSIHRLEPWQKLQWKVVAHLRLSLFQRHWSESNYFIL